MAEACKWLMQENRYFRDGGLWRSWLITAKLISIIMQQIWPWLCCIQLKMSEVMLWKSTQSVSGRNSVFLRKNYFKKNYKKRNASKCWNCREFSWVELGWVGCRLFLTSHLKLSGQTYRLFYTCWSHNWMSTTYSLECLSPLDPCHCMA